MAILYVSTDGAKWGSGLGRRLTVSEHDNNNWQIVERLVALEGATAVGITGFTTTGPTGSPGTLFTVEMSDGSSFGPYALPVAVLNSRGEYTGGASFAPNDTFYINASLYIVNYAHVSATAFNANANDGAGHYYYSKLLDMPTAALPTGGATGYNLRKVSSNDYDCDWGPPLPVSGATGYLLAKVSGADFDADWIAPPTPIPPSGATGYVLAKASSTSYDYAWQDPHLPSVVTGTTGIGTAAITIVDRAKYKITPTGNVTYTATGSFGGNCEIIFTTTGATAWTVTFGSGFKTTGTLSTGTVAGKVFVIAFCGDDTTYYEIARTAAM